MHQATGQHCVCGFEIFDTDRIIYAIELRVWGNEEDGYQIHSPPEIQVVGVKVLLPKEHHPQSSEWKQTVWCSVDIAGKRIDADAIACKHEARIKEAFFDLYENGFIKPSELLPAPF